MNSQNRPLYRFEPDRSELSGLSEASTLIQNVRVFDGQKC